MSSRRIPQFFVALLNFARAGLSAPADVLITRRFDGPRCPSGLLSCTKGSNAFKQPWLERGYLDGIPCIWGPVDGVHQCGRRASSVGNVCRSPAHDVTACSGDSAWATGMFCFFPQFFNTHVGKASRRVSCLRTGFIVQDKLAVDVSEIVRATIEVVTTVHRLAIRLTCYVCCFTHHCFFVQLV